MRYLLDCLKDLDEQFQQYGGRLYVFKGNYMEILKQLINQWSITHISFEQDPEPIWKERDDEVKQFCKKVNVTIIELVSHTLWNPMEVIHANCNEPPLNYEMFCHTVEAIGPPARPLSKPDFEQLKTKFPLGEFATILTIKLTAIEIADDFDEETNCVPNSPNVLDIKEEDALQVNQKWFGGERKALKILEDRIKLEEKAFQDDDYLPTQLETELNGKPKSLSAALRHGCLSVRKFYWSINDLYDTIKGETIRPRIVGQLIWREFFYTMSVNNCNYGQMINNPVCLQINWYDNSELLKVRKIVIQTINC